LVFPFNTVTDLLPVDQVPAVKDGDPREILESTGYQVIIFPDPANAGIRVKAGYDRIFIGHPFTRILPGGKGIFMNLGSHAMTAKDQQ
jgi:hypothetical protein